MSQSLGESNQYTVESREEWLDLYKIYQHGHSRTVTVPAAAGFEPKTVLCMRLGRRNGRIVYLKAVARDTCEPQTAPTLLDGPVQTDGDESVRETDHTFREVRGTANEQMMTIPADYDEEVFGLKSRIVMLAGVTTDGTRYLRIVPEDVWSETVPELV